MNDKENNAYKLTDKQLEQVSGGISGNDTVFVFDDQSHEKEFHIYEGTVEKDFENKLK